MRPRSLSLLTALLCLLAPASPVHAASSAVELEVTRALRQLAVLRETTVDPVPPYERDYFGTAWADVDGNRCRTRDDILSRDLRGVAKRDACTVVSGTLADPYTGRKEAFSKARASAIQIDHVIPLSLAWHSGASNWPPGKRAAFANDPANLLAVDGPANQAKGDSGPGEWLPPNARYRCTYVIRFVRVAFLYGVTITTADRSAAKQVLDACTVVKGRPSTLVALSPDLWTHAATYVHASP